MAALDTRIKATVASTMYDMSRGYHARSLNSNGGWNKIGCMSFMNKPILCYSDEIRSAVLVVIPFDKLEHFFRENQGERL